MSVSREQDFLREVKKALRNCPNVFSARACERCDFYWRYCGEGHAACMGDLRRDAEALLNDLTAEGLWIYCPDDEGRPRWKCSRCGKIVHKDPAEKLYCAACGQRNRKEA